LVVATSEDQLEKLRQWESNAKQNGVNVRMITAAEAQQMEPEIYCLEAMHSPDTGIIDVHSYLLALLGDAEAKGATLVLQAPVIFSEVTKDGFTLEVGGASKMTIGCRHLINAAGLGAQSFAHRMTGLDPKTIPPQVLAKGNYF